MQQDIGSQRARAVIRLLVGAGKPKNVSDENLANIVSIILTSKNGNEASTNALSFIPKSDTSCIAATLKALLLKYPEDYVVIFEKIRARGTFSGKAQDANIAFFYGTVLAITEGAMELNKAGDLDGAMKGRFPEFLGKFLMLPNDQIPPMGEDISGRLANAAANFVCITGIRYFLEQVKDVSNSFDQSGPVGVVRVMCMKLFSNLAADDQVLMFLKEYDPGMKRP